MAKPNSLQAILDRQQAANQEPPPAPAVQPDARPKLAKASRPVRVGAKFIGGHFQPGVAKQLRLLAAEEETTIQALLEEALELLFVKKGKGSLQRG